MAQTVNLSVSGVYTSGNDLSGLPPGALDAAVNVESRYRNILSPRRGFQGLASSAILDVEIIRAINFYVSGIERVISLTDDGACFYYNPSLVPIPWVAVPGTSTGIIAPDSVNGKSRFLRAGQNLYLTSQDGIRSLSSGSSASMTRAGVPKGLNLSAATNSDQDGFFSNNTVLTTTGNITNSSAIVTNIASTTGIAVDQYVTGTEVAATKVVQDLTYTSVLFGVLGNAVTIAYTTGAVAGSEVVTVVGQAVSVQIASGVSTATQVRAKVLASAAALALLTVSITGTAGTAQTGPVVAAALTGGLDNTIPVGTKVASVTDQSTVIVQTGTTTAGSTTISALASNAGIVAGLLISGTGIPDGSKVVSLSGGGPYSIVISIPAYQTGTGVTLTFDTPLSVTLTSNAASTLTGTSIAFYSGAQVGYRMVFGRVETDINSNTITRLGAPSAIAISNNISPYATNNTVTGTIPKNASSQLTFVQLYRSPQTATIRVSPLDQYNLVYERVLVAGDFTARTITITDDVPDSLVGIPLYAGSDREGILQANDPPPMCLDMCKFRDFAVYGNVTQPSTLDFTIVSVGSPSGVQVNDVITIAGTFAGVMFSRTYTGKASETQANREFHIVTSGTPSQNITDTAASLIRVINYDESLPVHAIILSTTTDLPGQILLQCDYPSLETFTITANAHTTAYDPTLSAVVSKVNTQNNGLSISKSGELEAVPGTNLLYAGDTSAPVLRVIPLRDYVVVLKTDGIYKLQGVTPGGLVSNPWDLTTKIIGADTAVALNSGVWMFSNQGVVSISDGGVDAKSVPIDDQLNTLIGTYLNNVKNSSFAIGYESDRKYVLCVPDGDNPYAETEHVYNYITNCWTTWDRNLRTAFIHSTSNNLYISRADGAGFNGISQERKSGTYRDFVDEAVDLSIVSIDATGLLITLDDVTNVSVGDMLYQSSTLFSSITEVNLLTNVVTVEFLVDFGVGATQVLQAFECFITWKQVFGDNPAFVRQFSEGVALFKNTRFNLATLSFATDFSPSVEDSTITGSGNGLWGLFSWGEVPWGGVQLPENLRFYIPQNKQMGSYIIPSLTIQQAFSDFKFQGLAISHFPISPEVGK